MGTQFITTRNEEHHLDWPDSRHYITTTVLGDLADRVRARAGYEGSEAEVQIVEKGKQGGYSEYTQEWSWDFEILVGSSSVFSTYTYYHDSVSTTEGETWGTSSGLGQMFEWLKESPGE